jgi:glycosyltransferase involved in cell wall biosynthesis
LLEHVQQFHFDVTEVCLDTAAPVTDNPVTVPFTERAPRVHPTLRVPLRYADMVRLLRAWRVAVAEVMTVGAEVVIAHPCRFLQAPPLLRWLRIPSVYFCHEPRRVDYEPVAQDSRRALTRGVYAPLYRWQRACDRAALAAATHLVTNSAYTASAIAHAYGRAATPVALGVPAQFRPARGDGEPSHILSVGMLIPSKRHDLVIRAAARTRRRWPVVIVSPRGSREEEQRLRALARACGVDLTIEIAISDAELCRRYRRAVATLYLAEREPLGLASLEAQACGCPVVVADDGGLPETLLEGISGWAIVPDPELAAACIDALEDRDVRARMSQHASAHGAAFTWERSARELERRVREVARHASGRPSTLAGRMVAAR